MELPNRFHLLADRMWSVQQSQLAPVWPEGRNQFSLWDGVHQVVKGYSKPVSVSRGESLILGACTALGRAHNIFEIGTGFGYSATWFAIGASCLPIPGHVISLDDHREGELGSVGMVVAKSIAKDLGVLHLIEFVTGTSPQDVEMALHGTSPDIAFIDANHHDHGPMDDYQAVRGCIADGGLILFHDVDPTRYDVPIAVEEARVDGYTILDLNTSCHLVAAYKDSYWQDVLRTSLSVAKTYQPKPGVAGFGPGLTLP